MVWGDEMKLKVATSIVAGFMVFGAMTTPAFAATQHSVSTLLDSHKVGVSALKSIALSTPLTSQEAKSISNAIKSGHVKNATIEINNYLPQNAMDINSFLSSVPFSFTLTALSPPGTRGVNTPHFQVTNGSVSVTSEAESYTALNSGSYQITLFKDGLFNAQNEGTVNFPYGQYSYETGYYTWNNLPSGTYNLSISTDDATVQGSGSYVA